jgi:hypothetical protein
VDSKTEFRFHAKDSGVLVSPLVQREAEYVELIVSLVQLQIELEESSAADFAKVRPPAVVNTYGAGKTVLGETVVDVMVNNAGVYDKCVERLGGLGKGILDSLRAHRPVHVLVCFAKHEKRPAVEGLLTALERLSGEASLDGVDESSLSKLIRALTKSASGKELQSVYIHFDEVGELSGAEAEELRCALLCRAQLWAQPTSESCRMRRLLFLFTGKALVSAPVGGRVSSSTGFSYLHMSALTVDSIRLLQARYYRLNRSLANVSG